MARDLSLATTQADTNQKGAVRPHEQDPRLWKADGWVARIVKNLEDDGWAVEMTRVGDSEPAMVSPWTMGRDKKNPKPIDQAAFTAMIKTATELLDRSASQRKAQLHKSIQLILDGARVTVELDVVPDEDDPHATLVAYDEGGAELAQARVAPNYKLSQAAAERWARSEFRNP